DQPPVERAGNYDLAGLTILGNGSFCASVQTDYLGAAQTGRFVTLQLACRNAGPAQVIVVKYGPDGDPRHPTADVLGTELIGWSGASIVTVLAPQTQTAYGMQAGFNVMCVSNPCGP